MIDTFNLRPWWYIYNQGDFTLTYRTGIGSDVFTFKTASLSLPKLITQAWVTRQLGEEPKVIYKDREIKNLDYYDMIQKLFGLGRVIVMPYIDDWGEFRYYTLGNFTANNIALRLGRIEWLESPLSIQNEYYQYQLMMPQNQIMRRKVTKNDNQELLTWTEWEPLLLEPFYLELPLTIDRHPIPIWGQAVDLIEDANIAHHEMMVAMNLQRPIILVPDPGNGPLTSSVDSQGRQIPFLLNESQRAIQSNPALPEEYTEVKQFGGNYSPKPYVDTLNYLLSQIGVLCGLGKTALSFTDMNSRSNSRVTATEIVYAENDAFITQRMMAKHTSKAIALLEAARLSWEEKRSVDPSEVIVQIQDNLHDDTKEFNAMLAEDFDKGVISKDFYLRNRYPEFTIEEMTKGIEVPNTLEVKEIKEEPLEEDDLEKDINIDGEVQPID